MTLVPNLVAIPVPGAVARPAPPVCVCDVDPEVFRVFAFAVLAFHRELRMAFAAAG